MLVYIFIYTYSWLIGLYFLWFRNRKLSLVFVDFLIVLFIIFFSLRLDVGRDYINYRLDYYGEESHVSLDFVYIFIRDLFKYFGLQFEYFFFVVYTFIFVALRFYARKMMNPMLVLSFFTLLPIALPYSLNATRQFLALSIILLFWYSTRASLVVGIIFASGIHVFTALLNLFFYRTKLFILFVSCIVVTILLVLKDYFFDILYSKFVWYILNLDSNIWQLTFVLFFVLLVVKSRIVRHFNSELKFYLFLFFLLLCSLFLNFELFIRVVIVFLPLLFSILDRMGNKSFLSLILTVLYFYSMSSVYFKYEEYSLLPYSNVLFNLL